jgi:hypothetical protein
MFLNNEMPYHHYFSTLLQYVIRKVQENQEGMVLNGIHQLLIYVDDINLVEKYKYHKDKHTNTIRSQ